MTRGKQPNQPTRRSKGKGVSASSSAPVSATAPWPRPDEEEFTEGDAARWPLPTTLAYLRSVSFVDRSPTDPWHYSNSVYYNGWLRITIRPTRFIDEEPLAKIGVLGDVKQMFERMGMGSLPFQAYQLYPELVRQFYASIELHMRPDTDAEDARNAYITFFSRGVLYELGIPQLCELYGFDSSKTGLVLPPGHYVDYLRQTLGIAASTTRESKLSRIRNPVVRIVAKILGSTYFGREEAGAVSIGDLVLLHYGLPASAHEIYPSNVLPTIPPTLDTNLGYRFAQMLLEKKHIGLNVARGRDDFTGSLLSPIFMACNINLRSEFRYPHLSFFDEKFYRSARIIRSDGVTYEYTDSTGAPRRVRLPLIGLTTPDSRANLVFDIDMDHQQPPPIVAPRSVRSERHQQQPPASSTPPHPFAGLGPFADIGDFQWDPLPDSSSIEQRIHSANNERQWRWLHRFVRWFACGVNEAGPSGTATTPTTEAADAEDDADPESSDHEPLRRRARTQPPP